MSDSHAGQENVPPVLRGRHRALAPGNDSVTAAPGSTAPLPEQNYTYPEILPDGSGLRDPIIYEASPLWPLRRGSDNRGDEGESAAPKQLREGNETLGHSTEDEEDPVAKARYDETPGRPVSILDLPSPDDLVDDDVPRHSPALPSISGGPQPRVCSCLP